MKNQNSLRTLGFFVISGSAMITSAVLFLAKTLTEISAAILCIRTEIMPESKSFDWFVLLCVVAIIISLAAFVMALLSLKENQ